MNYKAQGALEYLLLLAAAVVVVAVVISFMIGTIKPIEDSSDQQTMDFVCKTLDTNSLMCGCYQCNYKKGGLDETMPNPIIKMADATICKATPPSAYYAAKNNPLLGCPK